MTTPAASATGQRKLKIGIVCPYDYCHPGGVVLHISHTAREFMKMGHEVKIVSPVSKKGISYFGEAVIPVGRPFPWPNAGAIARIPITPWLGFQTHYVLHREKFDILHIHEPYTPMLAWSAVNESPSVNIATFHAYHTKPRGYWIGKPVLMRASKKLSRKIAVSNAALRFVSRHLPGDYLIIPNGVDTDQFSCDVRPRPELYDGKLNILFVGRFEKRKGVPYLIEAYRRVKRELPNTRLILVGPGKVLRRQYEEMVAKAGLSDVHFTGFVSGSELPGYYRSADVFCSPAVYGESFGIVLIEAMASCVPVVASDIDGYNSVLTHEKEGLLVPPRNPDRLAEALVRLLKDRSLRQRYADAGKVTARTYSWENIARKLMDVYLDALREAGR